jgi:hypothetical protein
VFWSEEPNEAQVDENGVLVSKIRSFKLARTLDQTLFIYTGPQRADPVRRSWRLLMAESMAFNRNCLGDLGSPLMEVTPEMKRYIRFYLDNNRHYASTRVVADVAILRSFPSMAFNSLGPHLETTLMEQLLIQYKIPFDIIFDQNLAELGKYRAVILANQESLSDRAVEQIRQYVRGGGGLVATGQTSRYNDWRRTRSEYGLAELLNIRRGAFGQGRVACLPEVTPAQPIRELATLGAAGFGRTYWRLPKNSDQLIAAIRYVANAPFSVEFTNAPLTTVMELTEKQDASERVLHWLNYKLGSPVQPVSVTLAIPQGRKVTALQLLSPDQATSGPAPFTVEGDRIRFTLPSLEVYNVAILQF